MTARKIAQDVFAVGVNDFDRRLFDELIPLPEGTSYNSYLIKGSEKTALLDAVDPPKKEELKKNINELGVKKIDYLICHHAEQDHSGAVPDVIEWFPEAKVVTNAKCKAFLIDLLQIPEDRFMVVADGEKLPLGGKTLEFIIAPWVHWPETMLSYLSEDKILFPCDLFGSHLATTKLYAEEECEVHNSAKRYYAEIMMPFRSAIKGHLDKLAKYEIGAICPSHGPIYKDPRFIIDAYADWVSDNVKAQVVLPYVSMHGSVQRMVEYFTGELERLGMEVKPFNLPKTDIGELAMSLVDASTIVIGASAVLAQAHPQAVYAAYLANALRPKTQYVSMIGSYGWGAKLVETITGLLPNLKAEILEPVVIKGYPKEQDFGKIKVLAGIIAERNKNI
jgi:flavorubredoxin